MKTFSEACAAALLRQAAPGTNPESIDTKDIEEASARYQSMHVKIQNSTEALILAKGLAENAQGFGLLWMLCIAFSHGVMIGIEMEKAE